MLGISGLSRLILGGKVFCHHQAVAFELLLLKTFLKSLENRVAFDSVHLDERKKKRGRENLMRVEDVGEKERK